MFFNVVNQHAVFFFFISFSRTFLKTVLQTIPSDRHSALAVYHVEFMIVPPPPPPFVIYALGGLARACP